MRASQGKKPNHRQESDTFRMGKGVRLVFSLNRFLLDQICEICLTRR